MISTIQLFGTPTKRLMDPVHGSIPLFTHEVAVIDHPLFQRLRHILQNDVVFMVFPGCKHDRFLHSVGTMHMVSAIFEQITGAYVVKVRALTLDLEKRNSIKYLYCCLRLAALLHDTGHAPFAHQFEYSDAIKKVMSGELFDVIWKGAPVEKIYHEKPTSIQHEHYSVRIAYEILHSIGRISELEIDPLDVLYFLETTKMNVSSRLKSAVGDFFSLFNEVTPLNLDTSGPEASFLALLRSFISGEIDADKMDYMLRDSHFSGVNYGKFNKDHLINTLRIGWDKPEIIGGRIQTSFSLAILDKGVMALEDFVYARYQLYHELYNHRTVSGLRKILSLAIDEIMMEEEISAKVVAILQNVRMFPDFTDTFFWEAFRSYASQNPNSYCQKLILREPLDYHSKVENEDEADVKRHCREVGRTVVGEIVYWRSEIKFSKIDDYFKSIKVLVKDYGTESIRLEKITKVTDFFDKFDKKEIFHLFRL